MSRFEHQLAAALETRRRDNLDRHLRHVPAGVLDIASNDYLGLSRHPAVVEAARSGAEEFGGGARASRLVSGHTTIHEQLETALAQWKGYEASLVFSSGYAANLSVISSLAQSGDLICCDKRNHASLIDACRLASANGAIVRYYNAPEKLRRLLENKADARRCLIVSDAVYSMDGDLADLPALVRLAREFEAVLIIDDAHGNGVLGEGGRGTAEYCGLFPLAECGVDVIETGTLSKAFGAQGGFVVGSKLVIEWLINTARPFIYSTGLNPAACSAALAALSLIQTTPELRSGVRVVQTNLTEGLKNLGFQVLERPAPIIPILCGAAEKAIMLSTLLLEEKVWCPAIRPPTVPANTSRLRATASAALSDEDIDRVLRAFAHAHRKI